MDRRRRRALAYVESVLCAVTGVPAVLTIFWRDWIEGLTGWDPDHHSGSVEVLIIVVLALVSLAAGVAARLSWRRLAAVAAR